MTNKSKKLAHFLSVITLVGAIIIPAIAVGVWLFWEQVAPYIKGNLANSFDLNLSVGERVIGFSISLVGAVIHVYGLLSLRTTFLEAKKGNPLSSKAIQGFQRFALTTLITVFVGIIQYTSYLLLFSLNGSFDKGTISIQFGSNELKALFMALLLIFVAHIFAEGKRAIDENKSFV